MNQTQPHNLDAEKAILAACLRDGKAFKAVAVSLTPQSFYGPKNALVWAIFGELNAEKLPVDVLTVAHRAAANGQTELTRQYLIGILDSFVTLANLDHYVATVADLALAREAAAHTLHMHETLMTGETGEILTGAQALSRMSAGGAVPYLTGSQLATNALERYHHAREQHINDPYFTSGIQTGFDGLDKITRGLEPNLFTILAARPSMGKSTLLLDIVVNVAAQGKRIYYLSREDSQVGVSDRIIAKLSGVNGYKLKTGRFDVQEYQRIVERAGGVANSAVLYDFKSRNIRQAVKNITRAHLEKPIDLLMVDYIQKLSTNQENQNAEISQISGAAKDMCLDLGFHAIWASQLNRDLAKRPDKRPNLGDLRDSGALEQDADLVLSLHRPHYYDAKEPADLAELRVLKSRDGATGDVKLRFNSNTVAFEDWL